MKKKVRANDKKTFKEVLELHRLDEQFKAYERSYKEHRKELTTSISNYMFSNGFGDFSFKSREFGFVKVNKVISRRVVWDADKLKANLSKEVYNSITEKQYVIKDMEGLVKYLKGLGVNPKKFKSYLEVETKVLDSEINQLSEIGDIKPQDIEGCYEVKEYAPYLRLNIKAIEEE